MALGSAQVYGRSRRFFVSDEPAGSAGTFVKPGATDAAKILADARVTPQGLNAAINEIRKGRTADTASAEK